MTKELTILHANDVHGQLSFTVNSDFELQGGHLPHVRLHQKGQGGEDRSGGCASEGKIYF